MPLKLEASNVLRMLIGARMQSATRVVNELRLRMLHGQGGGKERGQNIHVYCPWRLLTPDGTLLGSANLFTPSAAGSDPMTFDYAAEEATWWDERMKSLFAAAEPSTLVVTSTVVDDLGGFVLKFIGGLSLEVLPCASGSPHYDVLHWSIAEDGGTSAFVVGTDGYGDMPMELDPEEGSSSEIKRRERGATPADSSEWASLAHRIEDLIVRPQVDRASLEDAGFEVLQYDTSFDDWHGTIVSRDRHSGAQLRIERIDGTKGGGANFPSDFPNAEERYTSIFRIVLDQGEIQSVLWRSDDAERLVDRLIRSELLAGWSVRCESNLSRDDLRADRFGLRRDGVLRYLVRFDSDGRQYVGISQLLGSLCR
jgi:hypothetical protein